ncbi:serine hydrolase [Mycolicibacterium celeriflavum]|uniref:serine hydrolase domain-containing protein n=1 Tax=Mycolicibacterium celeriflavum TaxID=1249101 RepID=UPI0007FF9041|nr:serine hydrolase domain-containing protein [Mycolicibacterium celeriflavum]OBG23275.1 serine hydrolase [Mycolicibacterium celeriflavum]
MSADRLARFGQSSVRRAIVVAAVLLTAAAPSACGRVDHPAATDDRSTTVISPRPSPAPPAVPAIDFSAVSVLMNNAVAAHRMPGAVVAVGHGGRLVLHRAYGLRKFAGEPGLDGVPAPAEPMTEDTIFDLASLTKCLATATAVMQLYEQGKVGFDEPVQTYLPGFNEANDPQRARVTVRMLLTHTSGIAGDIDLRDPWGLDGADKSEGLRRALTTPLQSLPGEVFRYSDINFILLGALIEEVTGESEDVYVQRNVFAPLGMDDTRYLPPAKACGPHEIRGAAIAWAPATDPRAPGTCPTGAWSTSLLPRIAPTALDEESRADPSRNPDIDRLLRGTVHDPTARRMGGVAGHAGVFSTARDLSIYAQALLDRLAGRPSKFPLKQATLQLMTAPEQPGHAAHQLEAANEAARRAVLEASNSDSSVPEPFPAISGQELRGFGWDIDTGHSRPRGLVFPVGSFGHTGFTGTSIWMDPGSNTYVILLTNAIHIRGSRPVSDLQGELATVAAQSLGLYGSAPPVTPSPPAPRPR